MMNKRLVGIITTTIVILCVVVIVVVIPQIEEQSRYDAMIERCGQIRNGKGIIEAAEYSPSTPGPHRIVIFGLGDTSGLIPQEWLAGSLEEVELVAFFYEYDKELETCDYWGGYWLHRIQFYFVFELWEAKTGTLLKNGTLYGRAPGCPDTYTFTRFVETTYGPSPREFVKIWLEPYVMGKGTETTSN